jgi:hypothetical protein
MLSSEELRAYDETGLIKPAYSLPDVDLTELRTALDRVLIANPEQTPDLIANPHIPFQPQSGLGVRAGGLPFLRIALIPEILDMVSQLLGNDLVLWATTLFAKPGGTGREFTWHQDGHYYTIAPLSSCTVWIALDDVGVDNGCMRYIGGSHRHGLLPHTVERRENVASAETTDSTSFDESLARSNVLRRGQMSIHHVNLIHGSLPNRSRRRRAGFALRYMPATSHYDHGTQFSWKPVVNVETQKRNIRPLWIVRGRNRHPGNDFSIGHDGLEDLDRFVTANCH